MPCRPRSPAATRRARPRVDSLAPVAARARLTVARGGRVASRPVKEDLEHRWRDLGEFIRDQRRVGHLSLRKLSEMAGISNPYLSQIERGLRKPSAEILQQIARALEISSETLYVRAGILEERRRGRPRRRDPPRSATHRGAEEDPRPDLRVVPARERAAAPAPMRKNSAASRALSPGGTPDAPPRRPLPAHLAARPARQGDSGGMNVYVRELVSALAQAGRRVPTSSCAAGTTTCPTIVEVEPGFRVVHVAAGPLDLAKEQLPETSSTRSPTASRDHLRALGRRRRHPRQLLALRAWPATGSSTSSTCRSCPPSTRSPGSRPRPATPSPSAGCDAEAEVIGCSDAILAVVRGRGRPARAALRRRPGRASSSCRPGVDHAFFSPGDRLGARAALALGLGDGPVLLFVGRIQPLKGLDVAVRALAALRPPRRPARRRRRRRAAPRARPRSTASASWSPSSASPTRSASSTPCPTTCCPPTTGPPTSCSCRAARSRSGSWPSRRPRAARRWWRPRSAGCARWSSTAAPASSSRAATRRRSPRCAEQRARRRRRWPPSCRGRPPPRAARLHVVHRGRPAAAPLRRPHRRAPLVDCARDVAATAAATRPSELDALEALIDAWLAEQLAENPVVAAVERDRRVGRAALVRAGARRGEGRLHDLVPPAPAHAALRDLRDAGARGEPRRASTSTCCAAT